MERLQVQAVNRVVAAPKGHLNKLRAQGMVPAIVYGQKAAPVSVTVNTKDINAIVQSAGGLNTLVDLTVDGKKDTVMIKELTRDILLSERFTHVDFLRISLKNKLEVQVHIVLIGEAEGVKDGGIVQQPLREVALKCLPSDIPDSLELDITNLKVGESLSVADLKVPLGTEFITDASEAVVTIVASRVNEEAEVEEDATEPADADTKAATETAE